MRVNTVLPGTPPTVSVPRLIGTWESMAVEVLDSCTELIPPVATLGDVIPSRATTHIDTHISAEDTIMATVGFFFDFLEHFQNIVFQWRLQHCDCVQVVIQMCKYSRCAIMSVLECVHWIWNVQHAEIRHLVLPKITRT